MREGRRLKWQKIKFYAVIMTICIALAVGLNLILEEKLDPHEIEQLRRAYKAKGEQFRPPP